MDFEKLLYGLALYDDTDICKNEIYRKHIAFVFNRFFDFTQNHTNINEILELNLDLSILEELEELIIDLLDIETLSEKSKKFHEMYVSLRAINMTQMDLQSLETNISCISKEAKYKLF